MLRDTLYAHNHNVSRNILMILRDTLFAHNHNVFILMMLQDTL